MTRSDCWAPTECCPPTLRTACAARWGSGTCSCTTDVEVDDDIVLKRLANLADLDDFVTVVATWVVPPRS